MNFHFQNIFLKETRETIFSNSFDFNLEYGFLMCIKIPFS